MSSTPRAEYSESSDETYSPPKMSSLHSLLGDLALMPELQSPLDQQENIFSSRYGSAAVRKPLQETFDSDKQTEQSDFGSTQFKMLASAEGQVGSTSVSSAGSLSPAQLGRALESQENDPSLQAQGPAKHSSSRSLSVYMRPEGSRSQSLQSPSASPAPSKPASYTASASPSSMLAEDSLHTHTASYTDLDPLLSQLSLQHKGTMLRPEAHPYTFATEQQPHSRSTGQAHALLSSKLQH